MAFALRLALPACLLLVACGDEDSCDLDAYTRDQGGFGLMDCGIASAGETSAVDACAEMAQRQGVTFRAIYETDDGGLEALVYTSDDEYIQVRTPADGSTLEQERCGSGVLTQETGRTYVSCLDPGEPEVVCE
jgi:hypothetical protein